MNNLKSQLGRAESDLRRPFENSSDGSYGKQRDLDNETVFDLKLDGGPWPKDDPEESENEIILVSSRPTRKLRQLTHAINESVPIEEDEEPLSRKSDECCPFRILVVDDIPFNLIPITSLIEDLF
eukprot:CAMPEP_0170501848 /NCGR_PEP_ID=MMETSP0208-20121228/39629_1 /TAXON_ID=197538 /ORGANISM="Strombidium inclinatum, Strain S3" /LENGTH=124 /DNA_ID=CAMNT_0010780593 /DNA_START=1869 /DNA_END=2243 /DNA_ORIENTATION=+